MPTDPARRAMLDEYERWAAAGLTAAPSVRRAQIPADPLREATRVARRAIVAAEFDPGYLPDRAIAIAVAAAAPVLLSEYQQRIDALREPRTDAISHAAAAPYSSGFLDGWHDAIEAVRAALGSTKEEK